MDERDLHGAGNEDGEESRRIQVSINQKAGGVVSRMCVSGSDSVTGVIPFLPSRLETKQEGRVSRGASQLAVVPRNGGGKKGREK